MHITRTLVNPHLLTTHILDPYPIWIIDNFLDPAIPAAINAEWPCIDDPRWHSGITSVNGKESALERKLRFIDKPELYTPNAAAVMEYFYSQEFMSFLSEATGIKDIFPDQTHRWAGMRTSYEGSFQLIHRDALKHPENNHRRALTVLYYLNEGYEKEAHGGCLEIWDKTMTQRTHEIEPISNRLVIFLCTPTSYHGVPAIRHERRFLMASGMTHESIDGNIRALFMPRPEDGEEVRKQGEERSRY
jgi:hypothetical protein